MSLKLAHSKQQRDASFQKAMADLQASFKSTSVAALAAESLQRMRAPVAAGALDLLDDSPAVFRAALSESLQDWTPPTAEEVERAQTEHDEQMMLEIGRAAAERLRTEQQAVKKRDELLELQTAAMEALAAQSVLPQTGSPGASNDPSSLDNKGIADKLTPGQRTTLEWLRAEDPVHMVINGASSLGFLGEIVGPDKRLTFSATTLYDALRAYGRGMEPPFKEDTVVPVIKQHYEGFSWASGRIEDREGMIQLIEDCLLQAKNDRDDKAYDEDVERQRQRGAKG